MELTPDQMRARITELEDQLSFMSRLTGVTPDMIAPPTEEEIHEMLHGPRAEPGSIERIIDELLAAADRRQ